MGKSLLGGDIFGAKGCGLTMAIVGCGIVVWVRDNVVLFEECDD